MILSTLPHIFIPYNIRFGPILSYFGPFWTSKMTHFELENDHFGPIPVAFWLLKMTHLDLKNGHFGPILAHLEPAAPLLTPSECYSRCARWRIRKQNKQTSSTMIVCLLLLTQCNIQHIQRRYDFRGKFLYPTVSAGCIRKRLDIEIYLNLDLQKHKKLIKVDQRDRF